ncbi:Mob1/phocein [Aaosphaeria arxii CBS 175.79]|uniref:Mob1/phocein n=1 Tax=Aaosphaeria arxii CBS 175.79 TaxID=1450172 RepID=A0A6A5Y4P5_9PLEO|nr:Mob1/phocein [Aaosphaeria arxii CBS 175.79]KAF2019484.1 Mob1/phocein [Aaosphaeria arxii CBS 175.79]
MAASAVSPASSPRLPSPPPIAEDQLGPKSPIAATHDQQKSFANLDHAAGRRIRPGTKADDMTEGPPLVELSEIDSAFQLTEHLKALHNFLTHPIGANATIAVDREMAHKLAQPPENVDKTLWLYELCRFLTQKVNSIIIALFSDNPPCSAQTCPEMRASEWQYLCAVHDPPKSCCAIDYCCHTLDWAANTLTSPKTFPSRLALGNDQTTQHQQIRQLTNIFRRVYRIFAHAWFQHRDVFWKVEGRTGLYILFKTVCDVYGLIPEDNYTIPPEAEGDSVEPTSNAPTPLILKREPSGPGPEDMGNSSVIEVGDHTLSTAGTTKRHRHSPSVGATAVSTVVEENEEEDDSLDKKSAADAAQSIKKQSANEPKEDAPAPSELKEEDDSSAEEQSPELEKKETGNEEQAEAETDSSEEEGETPAAAPAPATETSEKDEATSTSDKTSEAQEESATKPKSEE